MNRIAVIGLAAAAALALSASTASAGVDFNIVLAPGLANHYPNYPVYNQPIYADPDCYYVKVWTGKYVQKANGQLKKKYVKKLVCD
jgi:hypothetical protein